VSFPLLVLECLIAHLEKSSKHVRNISCVQCCLHKGIKFHSLINRSKKNSSQDRYLKVHFPANKKMFTQWQLWYCIELPTCLIVVLEQLKNLFFFSLLQLLYESHKPIQLWGVFFVLKTLLLLFSSFIVSNFCAITRILTQRSKKRLDFVFVVTYS
jgi:hypothetical protein